jgi:hypothetical protein
MSTTAQAPSSHVALLIGAVLVLLALALAEFATFPTAGHRIDTTKWPAEAQAILRESPGVAVSADQWKRIESVLRSAGDMNYGQRPYWAQTVSASWWWFVLLPVVVAMVVRVKVGRLPVRSAILLISPSVALLLLGLVLTSGAA